MKIRYSRLMSITFLVAGIVLVAVYFLFGWNMKGGGQILTLAFLAIFWGVVLLKRTYFVVSDKSLVIHAILGSSKTKYTFKSLKELVIDGNRIFLVQKGGERQKLNIQAAMVEKSDWQALRRKIRSA